MQVLSLFLSCAGLMSLALAMHRHFETIFATAAKTRRVAALRMLGAVTLLLAAANTIWLEGASIGLALWVGELGIAALMVVLLLTYGSRRAVLGAFFLCLIAAAILAMNDALRSPYF